MDQEPPDVQPSDASPEESISSVHMEKEDLLHEPMQEAAREEHKILLPQEFLSEIQSLATPEEKLDRTVAFMQEILEGGGPHQFRSFWEARRLCLELFQSPIHPTVRVRLWTRYSELCREARRLKELFEEQSSFVTEQVEKAIDAIEEDFAGLETKLAVMSDIEGLNGCKSIAKHLDQYQAFQHELNYLNSFASRITALRKEVLKTEIRHKQKSRLLERLRVLGDWVYPRRKSAIQEVSTLFLADVDHFIQSTFVGELKTHELFDAREEIKILQGVGKTLTLSTEAFTKTRLQLSECWDSIKTVLKEKKKAQTEQRQIFKQHRDELVAELDTLKAGLEGETIKAEEARKQIRQIDNKMHSFSLGHHDVRLIREQIGELEELINQKSGGPEKRAQQHDRIEPKNKAKECIARAEAILQSTASLAEVEALFAALLHDASLETLAKSERLDLDRLCSRIRGKIEQIRADRIPSLSSRDEIEADLLALEHLRSEMKRQLEVWRKASGGYGYDFAEGLCYQELGEEEKARIERINGMIEQLEAKLSTLEESSPEITESCP